MKIENKNEYIKYRFQRAEESLEDALIMIENKRWNTAINRLYYSCFYAMLALLLNNDIETMSRAQNIFAQKPIFAHLGHGNL